MTSAALIDLLERALPYVDSTSTVEATRVRAHSLRAVIKGAIQEGRAALGVSRVSPSEAPRPEYPPTIAGAVKIATGIAQRRIAELEGLVRDGIPLQEAHNNIRLDAPGGIVRHVKAITASLEWVGRARAALQGGESK